MKKIFKFSSMRIVALILARGGSTGVPGKNIRLFCGKPLLTWSVSAALSSKLFSDVWVSTDDDDIEEVALAAGALVHRRSVDSASNTASSEDGIADFVSAHSNFDYLVMIQATSPLIRPHFLNDAFQYMMLRSADSLVTVSRSHHFRWSDDDKPLNYSPSSRPRRQDWSGELVENGSFYIVSQKTWVTTRCRLGGSIVCYELPSYMMYEIDDLQDFSIVEALGHKLLGV